jgi:hypothetical protein
MLNINQINKKAIERRALVAAGGANPLIPTGEIQDFEKPDFKIESVTGIVGVEVTELMPAPTTDLFSSPLAEKSFHEKLMRLAEQEYNRTPGAVPVGVGVFFWKTDTGKYDIQSMAQALADFVRSHRDRATPVETFSRHAGLPEGFGVITISATRDRPWYGGESVSLTLEQIRQQLAERIRAKNELVSAYRANLPNMPICLLIYSCMQVSRGVPMVHGMDEWTFPFDFDHVFFFSSLDSAVVEIRQAGGTGS